MFKLRGILDFCLSCWVLYYWHSIFDPFCLYWPHSQNVKTVATFWNFSNISADLTFCNNCDVLWWLRRFMITVMFWDVRRYECVLNFNFHRTIWHLADSFTVFNFCQLWPKLNLSISSKILSIFLNQFVWNEFFFQKTVKLFNS